MIARVDFVFTATRPAATYVGLHQHSCHELVYYASGTGKTQIENTKREYHPNHYALVTAGTPHDEQRFEHTNVICVGFHLEGQELPLLRNSLYADMTHLPVLRSLQDMLTEMQSQQAYQTHKLNALMSMIVIDHLRMAAPADFGHNQDNFGYTRNFMDENFNQKMTLESLAAMAGYSSDHFRHQFKTKFGLSPMQYLLNKRLENARRLLLYSNLSVTSIAMECGFSTDAQFCTLFKREQGTSPRAFRQRSEEKEVWGGQN
ncbi:hypothetical protein SY83_03480 [Paenibacillus swuensis]|uniref:HTH araC/xylS-type domain-containing protein n=1 Tax=Paenibacillus swuensis TaxID=1178515 RepID=A0A172TF09_9BACL|nr:AraC family transcriptional regulator [Paenibacillus swuensis]ANE45526.1 hypothetical protein SY83_03480 [Paenibacillus swuensis]